MYTSYIERQKWLPWQPLSCRVSAISAFCWTTTQTPSISNCLVAVVHTKPVIAILVPKLFAMATSLSTCGPHPTHDSLGPSEPKTQTASRSVQPFFVQMTVVSLYFTMGRPSPKIALPMGIWTPIEYMVPWAHQSSQPKRHLDRFSRFCRAY